MTVKNCTLLKFVEVTGAHIVPKIQYKTVIYEAKWSAAFKCLFSLHFPIISGKKPKPFELLLV